MDPFTERMLERARARREKLNAQLNNIGQGDSNTTNTPSKTTKFCAPERNLSTAKSKLADADDSKATVITKLTPNTPPEEKFGRNKENSAAECQEVNFRSSARSRLKRLGVLYSNNAEINDPEEMPSPIHRAELKGYDDDDEDLPKKKMPVHTVQRLAALANHINHWEDDVTHPKNTAANEERSVSKPLPASDAGKEPVGRCGPKDRKEAVSVAHPTTDSSSKKPLVWDREVIANLESQGFRPSTSGSRLVYDYANDPSKGRAKEALESSNEPIGKSTSKPEPSNLGGSPRPQHQDTGAKKLTPKQAPAHGSVLHRAALFESPTQSPKTKDPAELSVAERKALFEKNKGQALVPKAAFSMAVPMKQLASSPQKAVSNHLSPARKPVAKDSNHLKSIPESLRTPVPEVDAKVSSEPKKKVIENPQKANKVLDRCHIFEKGKPVQSLENDILKSVKSERQRELEMLASRWNNQKEAAAKEPTMMKPSVQTQNQPNGGQPSKAVPPPPQAVPTPPPLPMFSPSVGRQGSLMKGGVSASLPSSPASNCRPSPSHSERVSSMANLRKIKVSPAKPGCLYPSLSDIEATESEMEVGESEGENESFGDLEREEDDESGSSSDVSYGTADTSFGREIFQAAGINDSFGKKRHGGTLSSAEEAVFNEMDELLDEAMDEELGAIGGPTPPKRKSADGVASGRNPSKGNANAASREVYTSRPHANQQTQLFQQEDELNPPLMHTISFYRKQQAQASPCPRINHHVSHGPSSKGRSQHNHGSAGQDSEQVVQEKIKFLLDEVSRQQTVISQASQALNLCSSTVEFSESAEQAEGERLLLIATHRRQAALNEIQRLKVEGTLWPKQSSEMETTTHGLEKGDLDICDISLPLKKEFLQKVVNGDVDFTHHFVCLVKHQEKVIATEMLSTSYVCRPQGRLTPSLQFNNNIRLSGLYSDFKVTLEIYGLQVRKEVLSHEAKYHIRKDASKIRLTPKKLLKQESNLIMPIVQSPAGPLAVRSTAFALAGYVVFSLRELSRVQWTLNKVAYSSPLEGVVQMKLKCQLEQNTEERGFLTMFEDISGFGAWHRRWCLLHEDRLAFWKYPEDEKKKEPIGWINLNACSNESVGPVARHICARPNTFLLETKRAPSPEDRDSLVLVTSSTYTTIRHLLSADSKEERQLWCSQINKAIRSLRAWGPRV